MFQNPYNKLLTGASQGMPYVDYQKQAEYAQLVKEFLETHPEENKIYQDFVSNFDKKLREFEFAKKNPTAYVAAKQNTEVVHKLDALIALQTQLIEKINQK